MTGSRAVSLTVVLVMLVLLGLAPAGAGAGEGGRGAGEWHLEQPQPPPPPPGAAREETLRPIGLGKIGDIEFRAPNEGLLITAGNPPTIAPGVWWYNGASWRQISTVCGGTDGRVAWAGPDEFWTVSDGRPGQAGNEPGKLPSLVDNTVCHFAAPAGKLEVVASYATLAFQATSYQAMHGAGCISPSDCWFAGDPLPRGQRGAFQLHWNGSSLTAEPDPEGHTVEDMVGFEGRLFEGVRLSSKDLITPDEEERFFAGEPSALHIINPIGAANQFAFPRIGVPRYAPEEAPEALNFLHLSADERSLWGAANPTLPLVANGAEVTVIRDSEGLWTQLIGYGSDPEGKSPFTKFDAKEIEEEPARGREDELVNSIAAEPGGESAWLALGSENNAALGPVAPAMVARISAEGTVSERQTLPSSGEVQEGVGPKGAADKVVCPAVEDCWLATTQGWLFHLAQESYPEVTDPGYPPLGQPITYRPPDQGLPPIVPDAPPVDDSGERPYSPSEKQVQESAPIPARVTLALLSNMSSRLVRGTTLELRFHLAVKARIRLLAKRHGSTVASTPTLTLAAGNRKLLLRLNRKHWPTKLSLQTHALAPLPTTTVTESVGGPEHGGSGSNSITTGLTVLPHTSFSDQGPLG